MRGLSGFGRHFDAVLRGLHGLMQAGAPFAPFGHAAREFVDDHHFSIAHHELPVEKKLAFDLDGPLDVFVDREHADRVQGIGLGQHAHQPPTLGRQLHVLAIVIVFIVFVVDELTGHRSSPLVSLHGDDGVFTRQGRDDQRRARFIDQNTVGFVDEHEKGRTLHRFFAAIFAPHAEHAAQKVGLAFAHPPHQQAISQKVEAEFLSGAISDVAGVRLAPQGLRHLRLDDSHRDAQGFVQGPHPFGIATRQIVVHRGQVGAFTFQRRQIHGQGGRERLTLAGLHLGNRPVVHGGAAQDLHVEVTHVERPPAGFSHQGVRLGQNAFHRLLAANPITKRKAALAQVVHAQRLQLFLVRGDSRYHGRPARDAPLHQAIGDLPHRRTKSLVDRQGQGLVRWSGLLIAARRKRVRAGPLRKCAMFRRAAALYCMSRVRN